MQIRPCKKSPNVRSCSDTYRAPNPKAHHRTARGAPCEIIGTEDRKIHKGSRLKDVLMENAIPSVEAGTVKEIKVQVNDKVATNQVLMVLE